MVLDLLIFRPHLLQKLVIASMADWRFTVISLRLDERNRIPRSSAYSAFRIWGGMWAAMSLKKILNSVGERQLPCGTPVFVV